MSRTFPAHVITDDSALGGSVIQRSLRFNDDDSSYLSFTPSSTGNRKSWTWSSWVKRSNISLGSQSTIFHSYDGSSNQRTELTFETNDTLRFQQGTSSDDGIADTTAKFRDVNAWYHIVCVADYSNGTAGNRFKLYVNGTEQATTIVDDFTDANGQMPTSSVPIEIGGRTSNRFFDGYMTEINFIDGQVLDPTYFGYTESQTGLWRPKRYEGTYGTNGFHLDFSDNSSTSTLGIDKSPNGNDFTTSNFAVSDSMPDTPTNNFATYDVLAEGGGTYSEGNLKVVSTQDSASSTIGFASGKFYFEVYVDSNASQYIGVIAIDVGLNPARGGGWGSHGAIAYRGNGNQYSLKQGQSSASTSYGASYTAGDIIGCAVDVDNDTITFYKNGVSQGNTTNGVSYISSTGTKDKTYGAIVYCNGGNNIMRANFGQDSTFQGTVSAGGNKDASGIGDFKYAVPSGYNALCSKNLPPNVPSIIRPKKHFDTILYTGNGSSQTIGGLEFAPDWVWIKIRSQSYDHAVFDTIRGATKDLEPNQTGAEQTRQMLTAFTSDGFSVGNDTQANKSGDTFVAWCWKAGGAAVTNNDGSVASQVSANTEAGFSICTWTGTGSNLTIGHGLGVKPSAHITKARTGGSVGCDWFVYFSVLGATTNLRLNGTSAAGTTGQSDLYNDTEPTSSVITIGDSECINVSGGTYVTYCWTEIPGYSKFGKYTGNGSSDGVYVHLGFRPAWIMWKASSSGGSNSYQWMIVDNKRQTSNPMYYRLLANSADVEITNPATTAYVDFVSNGFKIRGTGSLINGNGVTYIYMAFAEQPGTTPFDTLTNAR